MSTAGLSTGREQTRCDGSVRSQCSDNSSGHECPICGELFDSQGDHRIALLNCDHVLCHHCLAGILRQPSSVKVKEKINLTATLALWNLHNLSCVFEIHVLI
uniref:RING-type domain-containing protein n=1 Tax=Myripristis murdjan TaxID=586833 RepID=A0A667YIA5_9TELE